MLDVVGDSHHRGVPDTERALWMRPRMSRLMMGFLLLRVGLASSLARPDVLHCETVHRRSIVPRLALDGVVSANLALDPVVSKVLTKRLVTFGAALPAVTSLYTSRGSTSTQQIVQAMKSKQPPANVFYGDTLVYIFAGVLIITPTTLALLCAAAAANFWSARRRYRTTCVWAMRWARGASFPSFCCKIWSVSFYGIVLAAGHERLRGPPWRATWSALPAWRC